MKLKVFILLITFAVICVAAVLFFKSKILPIRNKQNNQKDTINTYNTELPDWLQLNGLSKNKSTPLTKEDRDNEKAKKNEEEKKLKYPFGVMIVGERIGIDTHDAEERLKILIGEPLSITEDSSEVKDDPTTKRYTKTVKYKEVILNYYIYGATHEKPDSSGYFLESISVIGTNYATPAGIRVGDDLEKLRRVYIETRKTPEEPLKSEFFVMDHTDRGESDYDYFNYISDGEGENHLVFKILDDKIIEIDISMPGN